MDPLVSDALIAASMTAAPPPPPRQVRLDPQQMDQLAQQMDQLDDTLAAWAVNEVMPPRPKRAAGASLPPWLIKQRDELFREATSGPQESFVRPRRGPAPEQAEASERMRWDLGKHFPARRRSASSSSSEVGDLGNHFPARRPSASSSSSSSFDGLEAIQLREAVRQRDEANECVKSLTAEVVRLAGQLHAEQESSSSLNAPRRSRNHSPPPARWRDGKLPLAAMIAIAKDDSATESSVPAKLLQQVIRRRRRVHAWSAMQVWKALSRGSELSGRVGNGLAKRHRSRFSVAVLHAWDRYAKQQECLERALGLRMAQQKASAFDVWRKKSKRDRVKESADGPILQPAGRDNPQLFIEQERKREQERQEQRRSLSRERRKRTPAFPPALSATTQAAVVEDYVQRMNMLHYIEHVAIRQMHARWHLRRLRSNFRRFTAVIAKLSRDHRLRKRNFVVVGARGISNMLHKGLHAMKTQRMRGLGKQRALAANNLRILQANL